MSTFIVPITKMEPLSTLDQMQQKENPQSESGLRFSDFLKDAMDGVRQAQAVSDQDTYDLAMGTLDNPIAMMINSSKKDLAVEMTAQITTRAVNAYKEIIQMQV